MNQPKGKNSAAAPAAVPGDMDGGFTMVDGQKMRIVLDPRGIFKCTIPAGSAIPEPSSMDEASARAMTTTPAAKTGELGGQLPGGPAGGPGAGDQGGAGGFKVGG